MLEDLCPVDWAGRQAVVALPEHIDVSNVGQIREELLSVINRGATALIADMTATISCDHAGADAVMRAYRRAVVSGTELRLVVTAPIVSRVLSISGVDRLVSIYPSLEAATAASMPAAVPAPVAKPARAGTSAQAMLHRPECTSRPVQVTGPAGGKGAAITPAVVWKLVDALQDGVALAGGDGKIALVNTPLEEMFGYQHGELLGHPVESLIPTDLQAAYRSHQVGYAQASAARLTGAGARLAGRRKDGTTFPAEFSVSPVTTPAGYFTLTVMRDVTRARRLEDLADKAKAAAMAEIEHRNRELLDIVITSLFHVGLSLQAATGLPAEVTSQRVAEALGHLDDIIRVIRDAAFATRDCGTSPYAEPLSRSG